MHIRTPRQITESTLDVARAKVALPTSRLAVQAIMAGAFVALGGIFSVLAGCGFPEVTATNPSLQRLLSGITFPIGLILVVVLGAELFTGNNATLMPGLMKGEHGWKAVTRNWLVVYFGNFIGALLFAWGLVYCADLTAADPYHSAVIRTATVKTSLPWLTVLLRGIGANWCVCLAIWLAMSAKSSGAKMFGCWFPVMAFVALGYEHSIANMFFIPCGILEGADISTIDMAWRNLIPATLGNIVGGALFVGCVHTYLYLNKQSK